MVRRGFLSYLARSSILDNLKVSNTLERLKARGEGDDTGEMVGWHHRLNRHEFEQASGFGDVQGSLACCSL